MTEIPTWVENARRDAKRDPRVQTCSEFGKPAGDVSWPTPGRFIPKPRPHMSVSDTGPRPAVGGQSRD